MSIEFSAVIVVGLPFSEIGLSVEECEYNDLHFVSGFADATYEESIVGLIAQNSGEFDFSYVDQTLLEEQIENCKENFKEITGVEPNVYLSTYAR